MDHHLITTVLDNSSEQWLKSEQHSVASYILLSTSMTFDLPEACIPLCHYSNSLENALYENAALFCVSLLFSQLL